MIRSGTKVAVTDKDSNSEEAKHVNSDADVKTIQDEMVKLAKVACADKKGIKKEFCISDVSKIGDASIAEDPFYN